MCRCVYMSVRAVPVCEACGASRVRARTNTCVDLRQGCERPGRASSLKAVKMLWFPWRLWPAWRLGGLSQQL